MQRTEPRARKRTGRLILRDDLSGFDTSHSLWSDDEQSARTQALCEALRIALTQTLTSRQREIVELHYFEGLSQCEIARQLGVTQQIVQKCLHGTRRNGKQIGGALPRLRSALAAMVG